MKTTKIIAIMLGVSSMMALSAMSGPAVVVQIGPPVAPVVVAPAPAPAVTVAIGVPDTYVWDGYEYVGVVGTQYFYLGAGNVWVPFDSVRVARFHDWERIHADWRDHAIRNETYRNDAHGHAVPLRAPGHDDHSHDMDNHGPGHDHN